MSNFELSARFFLQLAVILVACRIVGALARRLGQPQVVAEMIAGVLLGPSFFGAVAPGLHARLFPPASLTVIYVVGQVGLALYMFLIGVEFRGDLFRRHLPSAATVSLAGIATPFTLGVLLASFTVHGPRFFTAGVSPLESQLFLGAAMSITAFPMLARILHETGLARTALGTLCLAAGSMDDAAAWCILAGVLAVFSGDRTIALQTIGGGLLYAAAMVGAGPALLRPLGRAAERRNGMSAPMLSFVLMLLMFCAWFTDSIGLYAVFGAFLLGVAIPRGVVARELERVLETATTVLLLPLFFTYSGLNTRLGLLDSGRLWLIALLVMAAACMGKGVACWLAALGRGYRHRDAMTIGILMNARGLMELIVANIGLERGIITPTLFTILVLMAVVTTLMAGPLFEVASRRAARNPDTAPVPVAAG